MQLLFLSLLAAVTAPTALTDLVRLQQRRRQPFPDRDCQDYLPGPHTVVLHPAPAEIRLPLGLEQDYRDATIDFDTCVSFVQIEMHGCDHGSDQVLNNRFNFYLDPNNGKDWYVVSQNVSKLSIHADDLRELSLPSHELILKAPVGAAGSLASRTWKGPEGSPPKPDPSHVATGLVYRLRGQPAPLIV
ncbi:uncharacterized protein B0I36DRAFT_353446 [Microdochium trichocladiopsis]|uniref:Uncharacterized protein n=1 Tax=Microdochium trichocladiopsis TaxID=1682393 RepID=A0A9P8XY47_9PEZI|nr:uncharacterized protein B0I36DRAFT_353446 [Microdochium trichocladiopsis]KAH7020693.1 hypothetical protein B0I36DRAFT_353446 [Microdochium trichocladiopsis]